MPWYRSLWLSSVTDIAVSVEGREIPKADLRVELGDQTYLRRGAGRPVGRPRFIQDRLVVVVPLDEPPAQGQEVDVEVTVDLRLPYMQIAPTKYVTNHASNRRSLVAQGGPR